MLQGLQQHGLRGGRVLGLAMRAMQRSAPQSSSASSASTLQSTLQAPPGPWQSFMCWAWAQRAAQRLPVGCCQVQPLQQQQQQHPRREK